VSHRDAAIDLDSEHSTERHAYEQARLNGEVVSAIEWALNDQGMSREDLARKLGVSSGRIAQILSGNENLTLMTLAAIGIAVRGRFMIDLEYGGNAEQSEPPAPLPQVPVDNIISSSSSHS
jgi:transcriptional regulator with XRE-family HTH domain